MEYHRPKVVCLKAIIALAPDDGSGRLVEFTDCRHPLQPFILPIIGSR